MALCSPTRLDARFAQSIECTVALLAVQMDCLDTEAAMYAAWAALGVTIDDAVKETVRPMITSKQRDIAECIQ